MATSDEQIQEILDEGDNQKTDPSLEEVSKARLIAVEECLHTIANYALELEAGKREAITAEDIRIAFTSHDVEEIFDEAKIFFGAGEEDSDLSAEGEEGPGDDYDEDEDEGEDEDEDEGEGEDES